MDYRGTTKNMKTIGRELDVATILEGGVQRSGSQVRINVQLINAETDEHLWAEIYDRKLTAGKPLFHPDRDRDGDRRRTASFACHRKNKTELATRCRLRTLRLYEAYLHRQAAHGKREASTRVFRSDLMISIVRSNSIRALRSRMSVWPTAISCKNSTVVCR